MMIEIKVALDFSGKSSLLMECLGWLGRQGLGSLSLSSEESIITINDEKQNVVEVITFAKESGQVIFHIHHDKESGLSEEFLKWLHALNARLCAEQLGGAAYPVSGDSSDSSSFDPLQTEGDLEGNQGDESSFPPALFPESIPSPQNLQSRQQQQKRERLIAVGLGVVVGLGAAALFIGLGVATLGVAPAVLGIMGALAFVGGFLATTIFPPKSTKGKIALAVTVGALALAAIGIAVATAGFGLLPAAVLLPAVPAVLAANPVFLGLAAGGVALAATAVTSLVFKAGDAIARRVRGKKGESSDPTSPNLDQNSDLDDTSYQSSKQEVLYSSSKPNNKGLGGNLFDIDFNTGKKETPKESNQFKY